MRACDMDAPGVQPTSSLNKLTLNDETDCTDASRGGLDVYTRHVAAGESNELFFANEDAPLVQPSLAHWRS